MPDAAVFQCVRVPGGPIHFSRIVVRFTGPRGAGAEGCEGSGNGEKLLVVVCKIVDASGHAAHGCFSEWRRND
jgi:hypothetical protein